MDAIERLEVSIRTCLAYKHAHVHGAFGYINPINLPKIPQVKHEDFLNKIDDQTRHSKEVFINHFKDKYGDRHSRPPIWMAAEIMTFGMHLTMFRGIQTTIKQEIAAEYKISDQVLMSWLRAINGVRNICAHHGRLWNREIGDKPLIPRLKKHPVWHVPVEVNNNRMFGILTILKYLISMIAPQSNWPDRFEQLLAEYPEIPLLSMGFPDNWRDCPIWNDE
jgi:abortive infection bacteriophage resistance protein